MHDLSNLTVDKARSSIVVTSLPANVDKDDIIMYFQSRKHGGGDINEVSLLGNGAALVTFEDEKCVQKVLEKDHVIKGGSVTAKSCPYQDQKVTYNVFSKVSAKIDPKDLHISIKDTRVLLQALQKEVNARCVEGSDATFVVSGSYQQIVKSHDILCDLFDSHHRNQTASAGDEQIHTANGDQTRLPRPISRNEINGTIDKDLNEQRTHTNQDTSKLDAKECQGNLLKEIEISEIEWTIFSKVYKKQLAQLMEAYHVILESEKEMSGRLMIKPAGNCSKDMLNKATEILLEMYLTEGKRLHCARFCLVQSDSTQQARFRQAVLEVNKAEKAVVERAADRQSWEIFGKIDEVEEILKSLESFVELKRLDIKEENGQTTVDVEKENKLDREVLMQNSDQDGDDNDKDEEDLDIRFSHDLGCVRISVYRGDITNETCDAIVNAANQTLSHDAGVAKAILSKGGQSIQDESGRIIATKGKLEVGAATITPAGKLRCKMVIHAVGPVWNNNEKAKGKMLLRKTCFSSLQQAEKYGFNSIAFPALSSGIYRMPKKLCAKVMFDVIEEYNNSISSSQAFKVTDVRFVNNDIKTVKIFQKEFKERYSEGQRTVQNQSQTSHGKPQSGRAQLLSMDESKHHQNKNRQEAKIPLAHQSREVEPLERESVLFKKSGGSFPGNAYHGSFKHNGIPTTGLIKQFPGQSSQQILATNQMDHVNKLTHKASDDVVQRKQLKGAPLSTKYLSTNDGNGGARPKQHSKAAPKQNKRKEDALKKSFQDEDETEQCPICLASIFQPQTLPKCKHTFCKRCLQEAMKKSKHCPLCREPLTEAKDRQPRATVGHHAQTFNSSGYDDDSRWYNDPLPTSAGRQPNGIMKHRVEHFSLPGYDDCGTILIQYSLKRGIQGPEHPNPGQPYESTSRTAYLPDNHQGRDVMKMLKRAFDRGLVFTVGRSMTSGYDNQIVWGDIPHKTSINGGPSNYGYPDPTYLTDVHQILKVMLRI